LKRGALAHVAAGGVVVADASVALLTVQFASTVAVTVRLAVAVAAMAGWVDAVTIVKPIANAARKRFLRIINSHSCRHSETKRQ
jgi:hypothetical protein